MPRETFKEFSSLDQLIDAMKDAGSTRLYLKSLSPNDNSKNQVYLGESFEVLNILPFEEIVVDKSRTDSKRDRFKANINFSWIDGDGFISAAPYSQLILYPKYPEVRLSGFLRACQQAPSEAMTQRHEGRLLFLGVLPSGSVLGHVTLPDNSMNSNIKCDDYAPVGVFYDIPLQEKTSHDNKRDLLNTLCKIHKRGWVNSIKLNKDGQFTPCEASNCGGYTLEALLGISPNGYAEPDYLGWEIKQFAVSSFEKPLSSKAVTLMTPEPTGGIYQEKGVEFFIREYGYPDIRGKADRINFGGIYRIGENKHHRTGIRATLDGFDYEEGKLSKVEGGLIFEGPNGETAASWSFPALLKLWNRKHAKAAYIPSLSRNAPDKQYWFGNIIRLGIKTDFSIFLSALAQGQVYLDPALKIENASKNNQKIKRRNQFRIKMRDVCSLYHYFTDHDCNKPRT